MGIMKWFLEPSRSNSIGVVDLFCELLSLSMTRFFLCMLSRHSSITSLVRNTRGADHHVYNVIEID